MKDIPRPQLLSKFEPKTWKSLVTSTCPKNLYYPKRHLGPLGVNAVVTCCNGHLFFEEKNRRSIFRVLKTWDMHRSHVPKEINIQSPQSLGGHGKMQRSHVPREINIQSSQFQSLMGGHGNMQRSCMSPWRYSESPVPSDTVNISCTPAWSSWLTEVLQSSHQWVWTHSLWSETRAQMSWLIRKELVLESKILFYFLDNKEITFNRKYSTGM